EIPALEDLPVNAGSLAYIAKYATTMTAQREIDASAGLEEFGLADSDDAPVVTVKYTDGAEVTLRIGDEVPAASPSSNYVLFDGKVYTMYHAHLKYFLMEPKEYLDTDITPTSSDSSTGNYLYELVSMTVGGRRLEEPFTVYAADTDSSSASVFTADVISAGGETYSMASATCLKLIYSPFDLDAADIVSYFSTDEDLAACGLDDPWATVDLQATYIGDGTEEETPVHFKLLASEPDTDGRVCVMIEGVPVIYAIDEPTGDSWYCADYRDYVSSYMLMPSVSDVDELSLETPDGDFVFGIQHGEAGSFLTADAWSSYPGTPSSAVLSDAETFSVFYETLVGAENDGWAEVPADTELVSVLKVTYRYADGEDTLEFFEGPARQNYVGVNGTVHFVIRSSYVESVIAAAASLMTGSETSESS
ncbi:MAG TPA: DUF4340 domain-containing protein, partial [Oscillospiraceae bacterium]|nr:DUF4340 domain-containing protein [Oscillospiraceae bacterium]